MKEKERVGLGESGFYDRDIYNIGGDKYVYVTYISVNDETEVLSNISILCIQSGLGSYSFQCFAWVCNPMGTRVMAKSGDEFVCCM